MFDRLVRITRKRTAIIISVSLAVILLMVTLPLVLISMNLVVKQSEDQFIEGEVFRVENILALGFQQSANALVDWSSWNDVYQFVQDENQAFIYNNLTDTTFINLDLDSILFVNSDHEIVYSKHYDPSSESPSEPPVDFGSIFDAFPELINDIHASQVTGLIVVQDQIMFVTSNPILMSDNEGPSQGRMIFIRFMSPSVIENLSEYTLKTIDLFPSSQKKQDPPLPEAEILGSQIFLERENPELITGYKYLEDIRGNPSIVLKVENSRDLYQQGLITKRIVIAVLLFITIILALLAYPSSSMLLEARERKKEEETAKLLLEKSRQNEAELESKVVARTKELELRNKDLETVNYTISHNLKSPLRGISGYATLLLNERSKFLDPIGISYLENIVHSSDRMNNLIEDLLFFNKIDLRAINPTNIQLENLVDRLLLAYSENQTTSKVEIMKNLEVTHLIADQAGLALILRNLLDNAIKFTQKIEQPKILICSKRSGKMVVITVTDNGIGFDPKFHDKIFEIFQRLHLENEYPGTGVGLALVKKATERLGGSVYAQSEPGKGSTFSIELPG